MKHLCRYIFDDALTYMAVAGTALGAFTIFVPLLDMPSSYGWLVTACCASVTAYRILKAAILLSVGECELAEIHAKRVDYLGYGTISYSFTCVKQSVFATWFATWQERDLMVAYSPKFPSFHVAYWGSARKNV